MKHRLVQAVAVLVFLLVAVTVGAMQVAAQQPDPTSDIADLGDRVEHLEERQDETVDSLKQTNEQYRNLLAIVGAIVAILGAVQGSITVVQVRREGRRDARQAIREKGWDKADIASVTQVSSVMGLVHQTLESRLTAEEEARKETQAAQARLEQVLGQIRTLEMFHKKFLKKIEKSRKSIEEDASNWASKHSRHDFRGMVKDLEKFAQRYAEYMEDSEIFEEEHPSFNAQVSYIRGIAALCTNQPEVAEEVLELVVGLPKSDDERQYGYERRVAVAYYYLGLIESNFNDTQGAIKYFEKANDLDLQDRDFLTRVVNAEAYMMGRGFKEAEQILGEVERGLEKMASDAKMPLENHQLRLQSRARLIKANIAILEHGVDGLEVAQELLEKVYKKEPHYYYATATLAQVYHEQGNRAKGEKAEKLYGDAKDRFEEAFRDIVRLGHLNQVTEVRSRILLLVVAGMCHKHGGLGEERAASYFVEADELCSNLPKIGTRTCTVFSTFSKRNESSETIGEHIQRMRTGDVLLV